MDPDLADLLAGYRHVLRFADARMPGAVRVGDGRWLRYVRVRVVDAEGDRRSGSRSGWPTSRWSSIS